MNTTKCPICGKQAKDFCDCQDRMGTLGIPKEMLEGDTTYSSGAAAWEYFCKRVEYARWCVLEYILKAKKKE